MGGDFNLDYPPAWLRPLSRDNPGPVDRRLSRRTGSPVRLVRRRSMPRRPERVQIMYGVGGERGRSEHTLDHLSGHRDSRPPLTRIPCATRTPLSCRRTASPAAPSSAPASAPRGRERNIGSGAAFSGPGAGSTDDRDPVARFSHPGSAHRRPYRRASANNASVSRRPASSTAGTRRTSAGSRVSEDDPRIAQAHAPSAAGTAALPKVAGRGSVGGLPSGCQSRPCRRPRRSARCRPRRTPNPARSLQQALERLIRLLHATEDGGSARIATSCRGVVLGVPQIAEDRWRSGGDSLQPYSWVLEPMLERTAFEILDRRYRRGAYGAYTCRLG